LETIIEKLTQNGIFEIVLYCEFIEDAVASTLARNHMKGKFKTLIIKAPALFRSWLYEDICKITGARPLDSAQGITFKSIEPRDLGTCDRIVCTDGDDGETRLFGGKDISTHIQEIKDRVKGGSDESMRVAWLQTKAAILKLGAHSDAELSHLLGKAKDGCSSAYWALQDGVVTGAGVALANTIHSLPNTIGGKILGKALKFPYKIINSKGEVNVKDASAITKQCVKNAISIAGSVLTICGASPIPEKIKQATNVNPFR
jgi:chaperonin GroEL